MPIPRVLLYGSPVPAYRTFGLDLDMVMPPMSRSNVVLGGERLSISGFQVAAPSSVRQRPPLEVSTKIGFALVGSAAMPLPRPLANTPPAVVPLRIGAGP